MVCWLIYTKPNLPALASPWISLSRSPHPTLTFLLAPLYPCLPGWQVILCPPHPVYCCLYTSVSSLHLSPLVLPFPTSQSYPVCSHTASWDFSLWIIVDLSICSITSLSSVDGHLHQDRDVWCLYPLSPLPIPGSHHTCLISKQVSSSIPF